MKWLDRCIQSLHLPLTRSGQWPSDAPARLLLYCASNVGLGHMFRLLRIARRVREMVPDLNILLLTDNLHLDITLAQDDVAVVKLPRFEFSNDQFEERPRCLRMENSQLRAIRAETIRAVVAAYAPRVFLMDTNPHGKRNELKPALQYLARWRPDCTRILQLRDIPFPPDESFRLQKDQSRLEKDVALYHRIWAAGDPDFFDMAVAYEWPESLSHKLEYLGFVIPPFPEKPEKPGEPRRIVASFGGGWEAQELAGKVLDAYLELVRRSGVRLCLDLYTGPALPESQLRPLQERVRERSDIRVCRFDASFSEALAQADLAILQGGSSPFQILETDIPLVIYARDFKTKEQQCRCEKLAAYPGVRVIDQAWMEAHVLDETLEEMLAAPREKRQTGLHFDGVEKGARALAELLGSSGTQL